MAQQSPPPDTPPLPPSPMSVEAGTVGNTSGQGKGAEVPQEIRGWNWGAFLAVTASAIHLRTEEPRAE